MLDQLPTLVSVETKIMDDDAMSRGNPPATKSLLDDLPPKPKIGDDGGDNDDDDALCAICNDDIFTEDSTKQLPCSHYYHAECTMPWLAIRNTCPVCRFELPTDDPQYKRSIRTEEEYISMSLWLLNVEATRQGLELEMFFMGLNLLNHYR
ncbi:hypothetical protein Scep_012066 [Stephania cephalantha]|uniref:RING-type domain-containing protein n=1 Tax=Stephania cephalantha TaxID=152367 RepID=A0AAP0JEH2_9MAGN